MKRRMVIITMDKSECDKSFQNICIVNTRFDLKRKKNKIKLFKPSGIVVLMIAMEKKNTTKNDKDNKLQWGRLIIEMCQRCKNNVIMSNMVNHHGSVGSIYSFGNQGVFKKEKNSTVGPYAIMKRYDDDRQIEIENIASQIETAASGEMFAAVHNLSCVIPNLGQLLFPVLDIGHDLQKSWGDVNLKKVSKGPDSMWNMSVCVNASTADFHTEKDVSYTLIAVPKQDHSMAKKMGNTYQFLFKLNENNCISFDLHPNISFCFSGTFLTHRQKGNDSKESDDNKFVNLSSYGNYRLFTHIRKSFLRNSLSTLT